MKHSVNVYPSNLMRFKVNNVYGAEVGKIKDQVAAKSERLAFLHSRPQETFLPGIPRLNWIIRTHQRDLAIYDIRSLIMTL